MLIGVFGTWTPLAFWGYTAVRKAANAVLGNHHYHHCNRLEDFLSAVQSASDGHLVISSDCPEPGICDFFQGHGHPVISFLDDPKDAFVFAMSALALPLPEAVSYSTYRFCTLRQIFNIDNSLHFRRDTYDLRSEDVDRSIQSYLALRAMSSLSPSVGADGDMTDQADTRETVRGAIREAFPFAADQRDYFNDISLDLRTSIVSFCQPYDGLLQGQDVTEIKLPIELFHTSTIMYRGHGHFDLCGPRRYLIWGPYVHLTLGQWSASFDIELVENYARVGVEIDVLAGEERQALIATRLPSEGVFSCDLPFDVKRIDLRVEIRLYLTEGAIEGRIMMRNFRLVQRTA